MLPRLTRNSLDQVYLQPEEVYLPLLELEAQAAMSDWPRFWRTQTEE